MTSENKVEGTLHGVGWLTLMNDLAPIVFYKGCLKGQVSAYYLLNMVNLSELK